MDAHFLTDLLTQIGLMKFDLGRAEYNMKNPDPQKSRELQIWYWRYLYNLYLNVRELI